MGKFIAGVIGGFVVHKIVTLVLHYEASHGNEEAKSLLAHYVEVSD